MFVSFEGIDGSGKTTQIERLAARLRAGGHDVVQVREPGGTELGERVRHLLLTSGAAVDERAELLLFCAARAQLVELVVRPALARGAVVLVDRFVDSTTAYQFGGRGLTFPGGPDALHAFTTGGLWPDLTVYLHVSPADARARRSDVPRDRVESEGQPFFERVAEAYLRLVATSPQRVMRLEGSSRPEEVHDAIAARIGTMLRERASES